VTRHQKSEQSPTEMEQRVKDISVRGVIKSAKDMNVDSAIYLFLNQWLDNITMAYHFTTSV